MNTRSLLKHFDDIAALAVTERPYFLALSETWLDDSVPDAQVHLAGYRLLRCDHNRCGGSVAVFCVESLHCSLLSCGVTSSGAEFLWISVACGHLHPSLAVGCFYHPPGDPSQSVHDVCDSIEAIMLNRKHLIVCGDFNINLLDPSPTHFKTFQNFITSHSLNQSLFQPVIHVHQRQSLLFFSLLQTFPSLALLSLTLPSLIICPSSYALTHLFPVLLAPSSATAHSNTFLKPVLRQTYLASLGVYWMPLMNLTTS